MFSGLDGRRHDVITIAHFPLHSYIETKNRLTPMIFPGKGSFSNDIERALFFEA